jgi:hypothetical protein
LKDEEVVRLEGLLAEMKKIETARRQAGHAGNEAQEAAAAVAIDRLEAEKAEWQMKCSQTESRIAALVLLFC